MMELLSVATVAMLALEGVKVFVRRVILKDPDYDFEPNLYLLAIPVLELVVQPFMVWLGVLPAGAVILSLQMVMKVLVESLATVVLYDAGLKPLKEYSRLMKNRE